jgi:hypothetical protein
MRIIINHLTRMHGGNICVAGIDAESRRHLRPVLAADPLPFYLLGRYGGPFEMARLVDLGAPRPRPDPPHVEDHVFVAARAKAVRQLDGDEFWNLLCESQKFSLREIFGPAVKPLGRSGYGADVGQGTASLGCLRLAQPPELSLLSDRRGKQRIRIRFFDGEMHVEAGVTDLRLYHDDHATPNAVVLRQLERWLHDSEGIILGVGLTRKYQSADQEPYHHWLQVNNLHLREEPAWRLM